ncbi:MAG TPA: hypothetical protein VF476_13795, partial [Chitinophagaceae bacterium]
MKKLFVLMISLLCLTMISKAQNVAINTDGSTADASSMLDVKSTSKGMLVPRMTTVQRTAIVSPANGLLVYDTDAKSFWYYNGTLWTTFSSSGSGSPSGFQLPIDSTGNFGLTPIHIKNLNPAFTQPLLKINNANGFGVHAITGNGTAIYGQNNSPDNAAAISGSSLGTGTGAGVHGTSTNGNGVRGISTNAPGVYGLSYSSGQSGVFGQSATSGIGVRGESESGKGVYGGANNNGTGVEGWNGAGGFGVTAFGNYGTALYAKAFGGGGVSAKFENLISTGKALVVNGNLAISGGNTNPGAGKVLTSDASGNATWQTQGLKIGFKVHDSYPGGANVFAENTWYRVFFENEVYDYNNNISIGNT